MFTLVLLFISSWHIVSSELGASSLYLVKSSKELDWKVCIICQQSILKEELLLKMPKLNHIRNYSMQLAQVRTSLQDGTYVDTQGYLNQISSEKFIEKNKPYVIVAVILMPQMLYPYNKQRIVYSMLFVQKAMLQKKREHKRTHSEMDEAITIPSSSTPITRSATEPLRSDYCFFCQKDDG